MLKSKPFDNIFGPELQVPAGAACGPASKPVGQLTDHSSQHSV